MNFETYIRDELDRAQKFTRPCYPFIWNLDGVCIISNPKICKQLGVTILNVITGCSIYVKDDPLIIVSQRPNLDNPVHLALLYHELAHLINEDTLKKPKDILQSEIKADTFASKRVGKTYVKLLLNTILDEYLQKKIATPFATYMLNQRISALS